jgi:hypothetical protein
VKRLAVLWLFAALFCSCRPKNQINPRLENEMPRIILWAWERPEDLSFINPDRMGVAFLAQTIQLEADRVIPKPRRQPLEIADGAYVIAVTRLETSKETAQRPTMTIEMSSRTAQLIRRSMELPNVRGIQIDFDAVTSEREFYRMLVEEVRRITPPNTPLTMTSLASWCTGDAWFNDFPVDEAVPMAFRMGADEDKIRSYLRTGNDWREPLCKGSYGIAIDDRPLENVKPDRRRYYFSNEPWTRSAVEKLSGS